MTQGIGVEHIIDIQTEVQAGGSIRSEFGLGLLVTTDATLPAGGPRKAQRFGSLNSVSSYFGSDNTVYRDAAVWFSADPGPKALYVGRWAKSDVDTTVEGANMSSVESNLLTTLKVTNGAMRINGENLVINASAATSLSQVADAVQSQIRNVSDPAGSGNLSTATCTWDSTNKRFVIDYKSTADIGAPVTTEAAGNSVDFSRDMGLRVVPTKNPTTNITLGAANYKQGHAAEGLGAGIAEMVSVASSGAPTAIFLESGSVTTDLTALEVYVQAGDFMTARLDTSATALESGETTSAIYTTFNNSRSNVIPIYSRGKQGVETQAPRPDIAVLAKLSSQNFDLPQSIITLVPKTLPGAGTTSINENQLSVLQSKQGSVYTTVGGLPSLLGGWTGKSGVFADSQWWLLWLKNEMELSIFNAMRASKRLSHAQLKDTINGVMSKAVNSGGAKPGGVVSDIIKHDIRRVTGNYEFDGRMTTGFVLWIDPPSEQTDLDREARISRFKIWIAPSEAIHSVGGAIILSGG